MRSHRLRVRGPWAGPRGGACAGSLRDGLHVASLRGRARKVYVHMPLRVAQLRAGYGHRWLEYAGIFRKAGMRGRFAYRATQRHRHQVSAPQKTATHGAERQREQAQEHAAPCGVARARRRDVLRPPSPHPHRLPSTTPIDTHQLSSSASDAGVGRPGAQRHTSAHAQNVRGPVCRAAPALCGQGQQRALIGPDGGAAALVRVVVTDGDAAQGPKPAVCAGWCCCRCPRVRARLGSATAAVEAAVRTAGGCSGRARVRARGRCCSWG